MMAAVSKDQEPYPPHPLLMSRVNTIIAWFALTALGVGLISGFLILGLSFSFVAALVTLWLYWPELRRIRHLRGALQNGEMWAKESVIALIFIAIDIMLPTYLVIASNDQSDPIIKMQEHGARIMILPAPPIKVENGRHAFPIQVENKGILETQGWFMRLSNYSATEILTAGKEDQIFQELKSDLLKQYPLQSLKLNVDGEHKIAPGEQYLVNTPTGLDDSQYYQMINKERIIYVIAIFMCQTPAGAIDS